MDANKTQEVVPPRPGEHERPGVVAMEALLGAAAGAATGVIAGPPGIIAGAIVGGALGATAATVLHNDHTQAEKQADLDREIGVIGGNIGEAPPDAPKSERGAFHAASLGVATGHTPPPSEGLIQSIDEE